ncbi:hypothetical protein SI65_06312 [Aspergillus cristatus]|uniref:PHD-type domain-containing protein n=1 Tax=Aspergillus cristatus TaxID=573508 RepID=A0A1E3BCE6_ASPCR|nr:hypothetical protein SI65_06312 [Aspergillus cristatus]
MTGTRESDNHDDGRQAKRPRLQTGRGRASSSGRGRGRRARVPTDPPPAENQQGEHTTPMQTQSNDTNNPPVPPVTSSTSADLTRYKTWRGAGSPHDSICFECYQPVDLVPCDTCKRSYHDSCKPKDSFLREDDARLWYCPVCVDRGWHLAPPTITPPASPRMGALNPAATNPASRAPIRANSEAVHHEDAANRAQRTTTPRESIAPSAPRKSRFNTLPEEVDSALWVVYRELESVPLLRQNISDLQFQISSLRQELSIRQNELALTKRVVAKGRAAELELQKYREEAANRQASTEETEALKAENRELELELKNTRNELKNSTKALQGWKQKLSNLIDD